MSCPSQSLASSGRSTPPLFYAGRVKIRRFRVGLLITCNKRLNLSAVADRHQSLSNSVTLTCDLRVPMTLLEHDGHPQWIRVGQMATRSVLLWQKRTHVWCIGAQHRHLSMSKSGLNQVP